MRGHWPHGEGKQQLSSLAPRLARELDQTPWCRHRDDISKIPMYADSIMKMLKDIRRTVNASSKLQPGSNAFTQFLDEVGCPVD